MDGFELNMNQRNSDQREKLWRGVVDKVFELTQQIGDSLCRRRYKNGIAWTRSADPVLRSPQLTRLFTGHRSKADQSDAEANTAFALPASTQDA